jgi:hypothetical protein
VRPDAGRATTTEEAAMDEDVLNLQIRKFLKKVGITSQREIEKAVRDRVASGSLQGQEPLHATMRLTVPELGLDLTIDDEIRLE